MNDRSAKPAAKSRSRSASRAYAADSAEHAYRLLDSQTFDAVLLDLRLPGAGGLEALRRIKERRPEAVVIVVTGYGTVQSAVQAMKNGAYDYVTKPFSVDELKLLLERVASHLKLKSENRMLREKVKSKQGFGGIVGRAPEMEKLYRIIAKAANSVHPVLILGESGTGKEMVARSIHYSGPFRDKPFIPVDCGSLVPTLIESELFGYVKGAFTGANQAKDGLMAMAEGGTIFLDEVGELPVDLQAKMLRAIQEKEIRPVGSTRRIPINVRILAATNRDLEQAVTQGEFPPRSLLPPQCAQPAHSGVARAPAGYSLADRPFPGAHDANFRAGENAQRRGSQGDAGLRLAGQCPRAGELSGTHLRLHQRTADPHHRSASRDRQAARARRVQRQRQRHGRRSFPWRNSRSRRF